MHQHATGIHRCNIRSSKKFFVGNNAVHCTRVSSRKTDPSLNLHIIYRIMQLQFLFTTKFSMLNSKQYSNRISVLWVKKLVIEKHVMWLGWK